MDTRQLTTFLCIAQYGSFSKAEEKLFISRQALLRQMNELENEIGGKLFFRTDHGVALTDVGRTFRDGAEKILATEDLLLQDIHSIKDTGQLTLLAQQDHVSSPYMDQILAFSREHPEIPIRNITVPQEQYIQSLLNQELSVWFTYYRPNLSTFGLKYTHLFYDRLWCVMAPDDPLTKKEMISLDDIQAYPLFVNSSYWANRLNETQRDRLQYPVVAVPPTISAYANISNHDGYGLADNWICRQLPWMTARPMEDELKYSFGIITLEHASNATNLFIKSALAAS